MVKMTIMIKDVKAVMEVFNLLQNLNIYKFSSNMESIFICQYQHEANSVHIDIDVKV